MNFTKLNISQICSVESCIDSYSTHFIFQKAKTFLFFFKRKEGFYYTYSFDAPKHWTNEKIEAEGIYYCKDERVWYKPHLEIRMSDNRVYTKYFETENLLLEFMDSEVMKNVNWINK